MSEKLKKALERIAAIESERANDIHHSQEIRYSRRAINIAKDALFAFSNSSHEPSNPSPSTDARVTEDMVNAADSVLSRRGRPGIPDETIRLAILAALAATEGSADA